MRNLTYDMGFRAAGKTQSRLIIAPSTQGIDMARSGTIFRELAEGLQEDQLFPVFNAFAETKVAVDAIRPVLQVNNEIVFDLPDSLTAEPWQIAVLFNLLDHATAPIEGDEEFRLIRQAILQTDAVEAMSMRALYDALEARKDQALKWMKENTDPSKQEEPFDTDGWPDDFAFTGVDLTMTFDRPLDSDADVNVLTEHFSDLELLGAWTGFQTEPFDHDEWNEEAIPYAVGREGSRNEMRYFVEYPPANPATLLHLFADALKARFDRQIANWDVRLYEL